MINIVLLLSNLPVDLHKSIFKYIQNYEFYEKLLSFHRNDTDTDKENNKWKTYLEKINWKLNVRHMELNTYFSFTNEELMHYPNLIHHKIHFILITDGVGIFRGSSYF